MRISPAFEPAHGCEACGDPRGPMILVPLGGPIHEWLCLSCYSMAAASGAIDPKLVEGIDDYVARFTELDQ